MHSLWLGLLLISAQYEPAAPPAAGLGDYQIDKAELQVLSAGATRVSVESQSAAPHAGAFPLCFVIDNSKGPRQRLTLSYKGNARELTSAIVRSVDLEAGERRRVTVPIPALLNSGLVEAQGPGSSGKMSVYFNMLGNTQHSVLALGTTVDFEELVGATTGSSENDNRVPDTRVLVMAPGDAPSEAMSYSGYEMVIITSADALDALSASQRSALESHLLQGGSVVIRGPVRNWSAFPLVGQAEVTSQPYGLGTLTVATSSLAKRALVWATPLVNPRAPRSSDEVEGWQLLPQATPTLIRFLLIIVAFTLVIGPGSFWLARRRGPMILLFSIPFIAVSTCALIIVSSVLNEGFSVHTAVYGYTWLDGPRNRALTFGLGGYYANLANSSMRLSSTSTVLMSQGNNSERYTAGYRWEEGINLNSDFMPSRRYREWGLISLEPTRAHVTVKREGTVLTLQNALGSPISQITVNIDGKEYTARGVADGAAAALQPERSALPTLVVPQAVAPPQATMFKRARYGAPTPTEVERFDQHLRDSFTSRPLQPNEFVAAISGQGFVPTGGVAAELHDGKHIVRGEISE